MTTLMEMRKTGTASVTVEGTTAYSVCTLGHPWQVYVPVGASDSAVRAYCGCRECGSPQSGPIVRL